MERDELRLECMKIAASRTTDHGEALSRAESIYEFVTKPATATIEDLVRPTAGNSTSGVGPTAGKDGSHARADGKKRPRE